MNPIEPSSDAVHIEPTPDPPPPIPSDPFWDYTDFFLFVLLVISSLAISLLVGLAFTQLGLSRRLLLAQVLWYALAFGALKALLLFRYERPFWRSLGWRPVSFTAAVGAILAGPILVISVGLLQFALRAPEIESPFEQMLGSRGNIVLFGLLAVVVGPVAEELAFRGFLMPLLIRSLGATGGIVLTGIIFGSAHGYEYEWSWRYMLLLSLVGCVLGWTKYKTKSTFASALMHCTFNLTQFAALVWRSQTL